MGFFGSIVSAIADVVSQVVSAVTGFVGAVIGMVSSAILGADTAFGRSIISVIAIVGVMALSASTMGLSTATAVSLFQAVTASPALIGVMAGIVASAIVGSTRSAVVAIGMIAGLVVVGWTALALYSWATGAASTTAVLGTLLGAEGALWFKAISSAALAALATTLVLDPEQNALAPFIETAFAPIYAVARVADVALDGIAQIGSNVMWWVAGAIGLYVLLRPSTQAPSRSSGRVEQLTVTSEGEMRSSS